MDKIYRDYERKQLVKIPVLAKCPVCGKMHKILSAPQKILPRIYCEHHEINRMRSEY